jgi:DNA-binding SARP family transcriptional activator
MTFSDRDRIHLRLLGVPRAEHQGRELRFPDRKCIALLAVLALDGRCTRARMATLLWEEQGDADARRNLRRELHRLRDAGFEALLTSEGDTLALSPAVEVDVAHFRAARAAGQAERALQGHGGRLLEGFDLAGATGFQEWLAAQREALAQAWREAAESHGDALHRAGDLRGALALALRLVHDDTLQEGHYRRAMTLHAALGEREDALALYERCRRLLGRELGLQPLPQTAALAEQIRQGRAAPAPAAAATPPAAQAPLPALQTLQTPPLVGREGLLGALLQSLATRRLTLLRGDAGIGKSRLLQALAAARAGVQVHAARVSDRRVPFAALARWLRGRPLPAALPAWALAELARLLPECGTPPPPITTDAQRLRFFEAVRQAWALAWAGTQVHVFDDWQFVDDASALWWGWWLGQGAAGDAAVLVAERPGQAGDEAAAVLREALQAEGGAPLEVSALDEAAVFELVRALSGTARPQRFAERLWRATGGHALYVLETLQHLLQTGVIRVDDLGQWHTPFDDATRDYHELPIAPSVQAAVLQRVQALDDAARRLLEAASLTGDDFSLPLAGAASALGEWDAVQALESALHARVLVRHESRPGLYRFVHDLFAQAVAAALSPERRRLMHRAIGQRLAQDGAAPARVAEHFAAGGDAAQALDWRLRAMAAARQRMALGDMLAQADAVLALAPPARAVAQAQLCRASALLARAHGPEAAAALDAAGVALRGVDDVDLHVDVVCLRGMHVQQGQGTAQALAESQALLDDPQLGPQLSPHQRGRLHKQRAGLQASRGFVPQAEAEIEAALAAFGDEPSLELGDLLDSRSRNAMNTGNFETVLAHARRAVQVMLAAGHEGQAAAPQTMCGVALMCLGRLEDALTELKPARELAHRHGLVSAERGAILNLVPTLLALGRADEALVCLEEGYALSPHFRGGSEQQAFLEARYQCRVVVGDLGGALDLRPEVLARSRALEDRHRRMSGLLVSLDLPLLLGQPELVGTEADEAVAMVEELADEYLSIQALAKGAAHALVCGQVATALQRSTAALAMPCVRPEDQALRLAHHAHALWVDGQPAAARAALRPLDEAAGAETLALYLAVGLRVQAASGGAEAAWLAQAQGLLQTQQLPLPHRLDLLDALADAGPPHGAPLAEGAALAQRLHASLASHGAVQRGFARRYRRWLPDTAAAHA